MQTVNTNELAQVVGGSHGGSSFSVKANVSIINAIQGNVSIASLLVSQTNAIVVSQSN